MGLASSDPEKSKAAGLLQVEVAQVLKLDLSQMSPIP